MKRLTDPGKGLDSFLKLVRNLSKRRALEKPMHLQSVPLSKESLHIWIKLKDQYTRS